MNDFALFLLLLGALSTGTQLPFWAGANQFGLMLEGSRKYCNWLSHQPGKAGAGKESIMAKYLKIFQ